MSGRRHWVFTEPCGCAFGVQDATGGGSDAERAEAWASFYEGREADGFAAMQRGVRLVRGRAHRCRGGRLLVRARGAGGRGVMIFDVLGVIDFLRARYGDALVADVVESHVRNAPDDFTVIELKLLVTKESMKGEKA